MQPDLITEDQEVVDKEFFNLFPNLKVLRMSKLIITRNANKKLQA